MEFLSEKYAGWREKFTEWWERTPRWLAIAYLTKLVLIGLYLFVYFVLSLLDRSWVLLHIGIFSIAALVIWRINYYVLLYLTRVTTGQHDIEFPNVWACLSLSCLLYGISFVPFQGVPKVLYSLWTGCTMLLTVWPWLLLDISLPLCLAAFWLVLMLINVIHPFIAFIPFLMSFVCLVDHVGHTYCTAARIARKSFSKERTLFRNYWKRYLAFSLPTIPLIVIVAVIGHYWAMISCSSFWVDLETPLTDFSLMKLVPSSHSLSPVHHGSRASFRKNWKKMASASASQVPFVIRPDICTRIEREFAVSKNLEDFEDYFKAYHAKLAGSKKLEKPTKGGKNVIDVVEADVEDLPSGIAFQDLTFMTTAFSALPQAYIIFYRFPYDSAGTILSIGLRDPNERITRNNFYDLDYVPAFMLEPSEDLTATMDWILGEINIQLSCGPALVAKQRKESASRGKLKAGAGKNAEIDEADQDVKEDEELDDEPLVDQGYYGPGGFFFGGRFDISYQNVDKLLKGEGFKIWNISGFPLNVQNERWFTDLELEVNADVENEAEDEDQDEIEEPQAGKKEAAKKAINKIHPALVPWSQSSRLLQDFKWLRTRVLQFWISTSSILAGTQYSLWYILGAVSKLRERAAICKDQNGDYISPIP